MTVGRKPKLTEVKRLGLKHGATVSATVASVPGELLAPPVLKGEALAEWHRLVADMTAMGTIGIEGRGVLTVYCQAWARMVEAEANIAEFGTIVPAPRTGVPMHNPHLSISNRAADTLVKLAGELGLTPVSRSRLPAVGKASSAASPWDVFDVIDGGRTGG